MHKKLIMACMAIAAFAAFIVAPTASASPVLTSGAVKVPVGTSITYRTTGTPIAPADGSSAHWVATLTENSGTRIKLEASAGSVSFTGTGAGGDATSTLGDVAVTFNSQLCFETVNGTDTVKVTGCGANVTFTLKYTSAGISCAYGTASLTGTFNTNAAATVNFSEQPASRESGQSFLCLSTNSVTLDTDTHTTNGTTLTTS